MDDTVSMALAELVRKAEEHGDVDFLRDGVRVLSQALMEVEVSQHLGAERQSGRPSGAGSGTGTASESGTRVWGRSDCECRGCAMGATSRRCWSLGVGASRHW